MDKLVFKLLNHCVVTAETKACLQCPIVFFQFVMGIARLKLTMGCRVCDAILSTGKGRRHVFC